LQLPEAFEYLFDPGWRYRAAHGGRGSAKSHSFAAALVIKARERPLRIICGREIQDSIRDSVKRLIDDKIRESGLGDDFISTKEEIRVKKTGSLFVFAGLKGNPEALKSKEGFDIAWIEEAATVSETSFDMLRNTIRKPGSEIWLTWNPRFETDPIDRIFRGTDCPPRAIVRKVNWDDNPWFPDVLREEMEWDRGRDPDKYAHIWLGEYQKNSESRVFHNWKVEDFETPADVDRFYFGADFGFSIDPTVLVRCYVVGRTLYVDHEAWKVGCEIDHTPALFDTVPEARKWPLVADSSNPQSISYLKRFGYDRITPAVKGPGSIEEGVEFLKSFDIVVHPRCRHVIDELTLYSYKVDKQTSAVLPKLADKKNHTIDALRYALETLRNFGPGMAALELARRQKAAELAAGTWPLIPAKPEKPAKEWAKGSVEYAKWLAGDIGPPT
jgi:phage terminase large subunit